jgi:hypothetical protein
LKNTFSGDGVMMAIRPPAAADSVGEAAADSVGEAAGDSVGDAAVGDAAAGGALVLALSALLSSSPQPVSAIAMAPTTATDRHLFRILDELIAGLPSTLG